ncbi:hypothetical protein CEE37_11305 [candidate division LCP-89 bacterium B3_LCP]|uniref:Secretion system C-terminal sorting domain-containing protein n=1 Tax=candidate division LCP-89 bacterium B3_LCP TaxID=2012998 RepID=A0A532UYM7_UNCL8|nr:MAG: hypothetical protein CEE37_11305 [candidate division LCP-89 bacterium B3_LCP]
MKKITFFLITVLFLVFGSNVLAETYIGGQVSGTWTAAGSPYYVIADMEVPFGSVLTIEPGVEVKFTAHFKFIAHGNLQAVGAPGDSIVMTHSLPYETETWAGLNLLNTEGVSEVAYCVIEWGYAQGPSSEPYSKGGGLHIYNTYAIVHDCRFSDNKADDDGGAIYLFQTDSEVFNNVIVDNFAYDDGGGIYLLECNNPYLGNNFLEDNDADNAGGLYYDYSHGILEGNGIIHNRASSGSGGGLLLDHSSPVIHDNQINVNVSSSSNGTGIYAHHYSSPVITYNELWANNHTAIYLGDHCSPEITNNTIYGNAGYAVKLYLNSNPWGKNNIIMGNNSAFYVPGGCSMTMTYSDIQGGWAGIGNMDRPPYFVDPNAGNFELQPYSPCIDAGDPTSPLDPDGTIVDQGAHYFDQTQPQSITIMDLTLFGAPVVLPPQGGTVWFGLSLTNSSTIYYNLYDGWYNLQQPDMQIIPLVLREDLYMPPGGSAARTLYITISGISMPGTYTVTAYTGEHPNIIESWSSFEFEKAAGGDGSQTGGTATFFDGEVEETFALKGTVVPEATELLGHFPEPFNPQASINFNLATPEKVHLEVYNVAGQKVMTLLDRSMQPGFHSETFDGSQMASGLYIYRLQAGAYTATGKMVLMK